jgi:hypothetical protein
MTSAPALHTAAGRPQGTPPLIQRRAWHRGIFVAAGAYNVAWGLLCAVYPAWMFRITGAQAQDRGEVVAALGLVIGLYGVLYWEVARVPERGWLIAAVGLAGKVLGPLGLAWLVVSGAWPVQAFWICLTNDFIWWAPFALYLRDAWPWFAADVWRASARNSELTTLAGATEDRR